MAEIQRVAIVTGAAGGIVPGSIRPDTYGPSKAALEALSAIMAKDRAPPRRLAGDALSIYARRADREYPRRLRTAALSQRRDAPERFQPAAGGGSAPKRPFACLGRGASHLMRNKVIFSPFCCERPAERGHRPTSPKSHRHR
jgi:hypothetical protein